MPTPDEHRAMRPGAVHRSDWRLGNGAPRARRLVALLVLALTAAACGGADDDPGQAAPAGQTATTAVPADRDDSDATDPVSEPVAGTDDQPAAEPADVGEPLLAPVDTTTTTTTTTPTAATGDDDAAPTTTTTVPQRGGTLRVSVEAETDGLNPAANTFAVSALTMAYPIFDPLAYFDLEGNWIPILAESFTKIGDGSAWQMKLREGIRFHDGSELDATDVVATFNAQLADPVVSVAYVSTFDPDEPIRMVDKYTVQYNGVDPSARLPIAFTGQLGMVLPSEWLERALQDPSLNQMPVGQGPFMIDSRIQDEVTVLVRNPDYWAADRVDILLDRIEIYPITDSVAAAERLIAGDLHLAVTDSIDAALALREAADRGVSTIENNRSEEDFLVLNTQRPPFDDLRVRQALTFATDRDAYVELIGQGVGHAADSMFHPDLYWHNPAIRQETNMAERAGPLVDAYCAENGDGCTDGRIDIEYLFAGPSVEASRTTDLLVDSWSDYFNVSQSQKLQDEVIIDVVLGNFGVVASRLFGAVDPDNDALWLSCGAIGFISLNFPRYCDPARDELLAEQRRIDDLERRRQIWFEIAERVRDAYSYVFLKHSNWTAGAAGNVHRVCGQTAPDGEEMFCNNQGRIHLSGIWLSQ